MGNAEANRLVDQCPAGVSGDAACIQRRNHAARWSMRSGEVADSLAGTLRGSARYTGRGMCHTFFSKAIRTATFFLLPVVAFRQQVRAIATSGGSCRTPAFDVMGRMPVRAWPICTESPRRTLKPKKNGTPIVPVHRSERDHPAHLCQRWPHYAAAVCPQRVAAETQKNTIRRWVEQGTKYETHWSCVPVSNTRNKSDCGAESDRCFSTSAAGAGWAEAFARSRSPDVGAPP